MKKNSAKILALKAIVNSVLEVDVDSPRRLEDLIQARAVCYKIMRDDMYFTYNFIAKVFGKNHATVLHGYNEFPYMIKFNKTLEHNYHKIKALWHRESGEHEEFNPLQLKKEIKTLTEKNNLLNLSMIEVQAELKTLRKNNSDYKTITEMLQRRTPEKRLHEVEEKLKLILHGKS